MTTIGTHSTIGMLDDDAFDAYIANEQFHKIQRVEMMAEFLLRAARRFHILDAEQSAAVNADQMLPDMKQKAWEFLYDQFCNSISDLKMFFSETDDYWEQSPEERKRLNAVADALVCSGKDASKIAQAEQLARQAGKLALEYCKVQLPLQVLRSAAGYYIGTFDDESGPCTRESVEYWAKREDAKEALDTGFWTQLAHL